MSTSLETQKKACENGIKLSNSYGQTETCSQIFATPFSQDLKILKTVGKSLSKETLLSFDDLDCITITSSHIAYGIFANQKFSEILKTNDLGKFDSNGNLCILGRADDIINSAGKKISPQRIDEVIRSLFPEVKLSVTQAIADKIFGEVAVTLIEAENIIDESFLREKLQTVLSSFEMPKLILQTTNTDELKSGIKLNKRLIKEKLNEAYKFNEILGRPQICGNLTAPWLFVFHGFMGCYKDFQFLYEILSKKYLLFFSNLPGHHKSNQTSFESFDDYTQELAVLLNQRSESISLIGYSLGGRIASVLASKKIPLSHLILESSGLGISDEEKPMRAQNDKILLDGISTQAEFEEFLGRWYDQEIFTGIKSDLNKFRDLLSRKEVSLIAGYKHSLKIHGQAQMPNLLASKLVSSCTHTAYIGGEMDKKYAQIADKFKSAGAQVYVLPNAGHNVHYSCNLEYLKIIEYLLLK